MVSYAAPAAVSRFSLAHGSTSSLPQRHNWNVVDSAKELRCVTTGTSTTSFLNCSCGVSLFTGTSVTLSMNLFHVVHFSNLLQLLNHCRLVLHTNERVDNLVQELLHDAHTLSSRRPVAYAQQSDSRQSWWSSSSSSFWCHGWQDWHSSHFFNGTLSTRDGNLHVRDGGCTQFRTVCPPARNVFPEHTISWLKITPYSDFQVCRPKVVSWSSACHVLFASYNCTTSRFFFSGCFFFPGWFFFSPGCFFF